MKVKILILVMLCLPVQARSYKKIPSPEIMSTQVLLAPGSVFSISGSGFIDNFPQAHKLRLKQGKKRYRAKVLSSSVDSLIIEAPRNLAYGNYDLELRIRTNLLRSSLTRTRELVAIRPQAAPRLRFKHNVINRTNELNEVVLESSFNGYSLTPQIKNGDLTLGPNQIYCVYTVNGWESLVSETSTLYYFPEAEMKSALALESENPLKTLALSRDSSFDVSSVTEFEVDDLTKHFYLTTPSHPKYLEHIISLSPVFIEELHVKADEYAVLRNRSSEDFLLENCTLSDSLKIRHEFNPTDSIPAKQSIKLEANLGLNDTSPDSLSLDCNEEQIDWFQYKGLDAEGFGIRDN